MTTTTAITIPTIETDRRYADARAANAKSAADAAAFLAELRELGEQRGRGSAAQAAYADKNARRRDVEFEAAEARRAFFGEIAAAKDRLREHLEARSDYRALVRDALAGWVAGHEGMLALYATVNEARQHGLAVEMLPQALEAEIFQTVAFARAQVRRGVVKLADLPDALKALVER